MSRAIRLTVLIALLTVFARGFDTLPVAAAAEIPNAVLNAPSVVYFPQTGHSLGNAFFDYWNANGGLARFGFPVTEEVATRIGNEMLTVQYFERARFEYHADKVGTPYAVLLGQLGRDLAGNRTDGPFMPVTKNTKDTLNDEGALFFDETKHTLANGFRLYWQANSALPIYGYPLSQEFSEKNVDDGKTYTVQYFERARFEWHLDAKGGGSVFIGLLGKQDAAKSPITMAPRARGNLTEWAPDLFEKWIEIDLSAQRLNAHIGNAVVFTTLVSTGVANHPTPTGEYRTYTKLAKDDMTNGKAAGADYYYLPDVPWVMYFLSGGYAIHGTYWHSNFGTVQSHGCVNVSIDGARQLFNWAPLGTRIVVHD